MARIINTGVWYCVKRYSHDSHSFFITTRRETVEEALDRGFECHGKKKLAFLAKNKK